MSTPGENALSAYLVAEREKFYRLAYSCLHHREDALDAVQTAVCRALERQDSLRSPDAMRTWFYRILMNVCQDILRRRVRVVPLSEWEEAGREDPLPADDSLARQVDALPEAVGTVIRLRFYEELSLKEISAITGSNINTVKSRLYAGLRKLRISMEGAEIT
ncbi:MAG: sigma-70 family RNA polymerase sigma factor [Clostridia bacterium]|nr:sigma-70 family RNA polymerase sigma factor [Clostridia bacterium]MCI9316930.1 sigma-70 family RNA polymerase sigma factor [Oscillospiraceae bacterium]